MDIIKEIQTNAKCYNKHITPDFLNSLQPLNQLAFVHPLDRPELAKELKNEEIITSDELRHWGRRKDERNKKYNKDGKKSID